MTTTNLGLMMTSTLTIPINHHGEEKKIWNARQKQQYATMMAHPVPRNR
jgi:hypothetical protein